MKTTQDILDFYGVEIGKKYKVIKVYKGVSNGFLYETFTITDDSWALGGVQIELESNRTEFAITLLSHFDYEEVKSSILDDEEREYLQKYVMDNPAFKGKVQYIKKCKRYNPSKRGEEYLFVNAEGNGGVISPCFKSNSMYKGMKLEKEYTPQELDLEE